MPPTIQSAVENLIKEIENYESDTFSAEGVGLTRAEAEAIAARFIQRLADSSGSSDGFDGITLTEHLELVRDGE